MHTPKHRQLRGRLTGDIGDTQEFYEVLRAYAEEKGWAVTFEEGPARFGDHGPIHKVTFGFTSK